MWLVFSCNSICARVLQHSTPRHIFLSYFMTCSSVLDKTQQKKHVLHRFRVSKVCLHALNGCRRTKFERMSVLHHHVRRRVVLGRQTCDCRAGLSGLICMISKRQKYVFSVMNALDGLFTQPRSTVAAILFHSLKRYDKVPFSCPPLNEIFSNLCRRFVECMHVYHYVCFVCPCIHVCPCIKRVCMYSCAGITYLMFLHGIVSGVFMFNGFKLLLWTENACGHLQVIDGMATVGKIEEVHVYIMNACICVHFLACMCL